MTSLIKLARKTIAMAMLAAVAGVMCLGCGVKSPPIPPEFAKPARIADLEAVSQKNGIQLTWTRPDKYAGGDTMHDLGGFTIARSEGDGAYQKIGNIAVDDQGRFQVQRSFTYRDTATELGKTYRYQVYSNTTDGYVSDSSNAVAIVRKNPPPPPNPENFQLPTTTAPLP